MLKKVVLFNTFAETVLHFFLVFWLESSKAFIEYIDFYIICVFAVTFEQNNMPLLNKNINKKKFQRELI